jgi:hypothetical protein
MSASSTRSGFIITLADEGALTWVLENINSLSNHFLLKETEAITKKSPDWSYNRQQEDLTFFSYLISLNSRVLETCWVRQLLSHTDADSLEVIIDNINKNTQKFSYH